MNIDFELYSMYYVKNTLIIKVFEARNNFGGIRIWESKSSE